MLLLLILSFSCLWAGTLALPKSPMTYVTDSSYTILMTDTSIWFATNASSVDVYLPPSNSTNAGTTFYLMDGTCNAGTNPINLHPDGTDSILTPPSYGSGQVWQIYSNCYSMRILADGFGMWFGITN